MRQNRKAILGLLLFVVCLMAITMVGGRRMQAKLDAGASQIRVLEESIAAENARTDEIRALQAYMQSDEYKEQVAKDKLGLVRDGEIIFKESSKE